MTSLAGLREAKEVFASLPQGFIGMSLGTDIAGGMLKKVASPM